MKKIYRELAREFPFAEIESVNNKHIRIRLPNGRSVFTSATPSDRRHMLNTRAEVRRKMGLRAASRLVNQVTLDKD